MTQENTNGDTRSAAPSAQDRPQIPQHEVSIADLSKKILATDKQYDLSKILSAYQLAEKAHADQKRSSGEPYIIHPLAVADILLDLGMDTDTICVGLLHDVVEDTNYTLDDIRKKFGQDVAMLVDGVTKLNRIPIFDKEQQQAENVRKILLAMSHDIRVMIIKLADRLHNMRTLHFLPPEKRSRISKETLNVYAPMADQLGIWKIKEELSDRAIMFLDPCGCYEIEKELQLKDEDAKNFIEKIQQELRKGLEKSTVIKNPPEVTGRVKSLYSIYRKVYAAIRKEDMHEISEVYDKYAARIIVDTVEECYVAMSVVGMLYQPLPNRTKDYIAMPKPNGYRSIHMTVYAYGLPFEVQIRTHAMHQAAEYGIVAHWKYKQGETSGNMDQWTNWARKLIEEQQNSDDMEEFVRNLKNDARQDVGILTPKGKPIFLPKGSTPIDFAYRIHTEVGNRMIGAKVNGKLVPLDQPLQIGQICEIECSKDPNKGPNRDWLNIVKTTEARSKIRSWLKKECREENIQTGRKTLENELRRNHIRMENDEKLTELLHDEMIRYKCETLDDFLASVGYCGINVSNLIPRLKDRYDKLYKKQEEEKPLSAENMPVYVQKKEDDSYVIVDQIDNLPNHCANCCHPVPGDEIVTFTTRGYGLAIHRADCPNYLRDLKSGDPERIGRWNKAKWTETAAAAPIVASLDVLAPDRIGLLMDVIKIVVDSRMMIVHSRSYNLKNGNAVCEITVRLNGNDQLQQLMDKLKRIPGVISVERTKKG